jgi:putative redox protein
MTVSAGEGKNPGPMQLLLYGLSTCALSDVVIILRKQRVDFDDLRCDIDAVRSEEGARPYEKIHLKFSVTSSKLTPEKFERVLDLSFKYCGVHATLQGGPATITHESTVIQKT